MWKLVEPLVTATWVLRTPIALCALIFGGMAILNEISRWHERDAAYDAAVKACAGKLAQQGGKDSSC